MALPEEQLPLVLPQVESYEPTDDGESPLSKMTCLLYTSQHDESRRTGI